VDLLVVVFNPDFGKIQIVVVREWGWRRKKGRKRKQAWVRHRISSHNHHHHHHHHHLEVRGRDNALSFTHSPRRVTGQDSRRVTGQDEKRKEERKDHWDLKEIIIKGTTTRIEECEWE
jgi:hypothetical protein